MNTTPAQASVPRSQADFSNGPDRHIFRFTYQGEERPLGGYLLGRYRYGRDEEWARSFYPRRVTLNDRPVDAQTRVRAGGRVAYLHLRAEEPPTLPLPPPLHEDGRLLALLKNDNVPVNPAGVFYFTSLAIAAREASGNPELTPLHRLDLETSGPVLFAKRAADLKALHQLFHRKAIAKRYRALVHGAFPSGLKEISGYIVPDTGSRIHTKLRLEPASPETAPPETAPPETAPPETAPREEMPGEDHPAASRPAPLRPVPLRPNGGAEVSHTRILAVRHGPGGRFSELLLEPVTGKTNQLRVHLAHVGHPIVGDKKYHPDEAVFLDWYRHRDFERLRTRLLLPRQALHCESLTFRHPFSGEWVEIRAPEEIWREKLSGLIDSASGP